MKVFWGIMIPFVGTSIGAGMVFFMRREFEGIFKKILIGFASGVMLAASIWSLLIPSIEMALKQGVIAWVPATVGFMMGVFFLIGIEKFMFNVGDNKLFLMILAVVLHNIPEGMAVGVAFAGAMAVSPVITMVEAFSLSLGIAIQNFPEGAIISMPLRDSGKNKYMAFVGGVLSGVVEPIFSFITILLVSGITVILPYLLSFAAGAMIYVVVCDLIPESQKGESFFGMFGLMMGFLLMMILDVAF